MTTSSNASDADEQRPVRADTTCPICKGAGYLVRDVPFGHPDFNRLIPCRCKLQDTEGRQQERLRKLSNLGELARMTFTSFMPEGYGLPEDKRLNLRLACEEARAFAEKPRGWLVLLGGYGCGKTHLAAAIANAVIARGEPALFVVVPDLLDHLRATFGPHSEVSFDERFESVRAAPLLILDDLGSQAGSAWAQEKLYQILNHRYNARLATVITSNCQLEDLEPRIRSRLTDMDLSRIVGIRAPDYRQSGQTGSDAIQNGLNSISQVADMTFDRFSFREGELDKGGQENLMRAVELAREFAEKPEKRWLVFTGGHGSGKTHLAAAIANFRHTHDLPVVFVMVPDLLDYLRAAYSPTSQTSFDKRFEEVRRAPFLILDDLGTESATPWAREKLYQIVNYRYNMRLPTVFTTADAMDKIEPKLRARMVVRERCELFELEAPEYTGAGGRKKASRRPSQTHSSRP